MKIGFFDPYLDTLGGGERYALTLAQYLLSRGDQVEIFWPEEKIVAEAKKRFNLQLDHLQINANLYRRLSQKNNLFQKFFLTSSYDCLFYLSDGSLPFLFSKKNIVHFQVPFHDVAGKKLINQLKLKLVDRIVCNSQFTKKFIDREYGVNSMVIYPPVAVTDFRPLKKENLILSVGRFDSPLHDKKQQVLIEVFKKMNLSGWQLVLVGGANPAMSSFLRTLKRRARGQPIKILVNLDFTQLKKLYGKAKIYWHAAGFGIDEEKNPEKVEHFGMSTVEAMAAGCVPVVCGKGGQKEIIIHENNGFLWQNQQKLAQFTLALVKDEKMREKMAFDAIKRSTVFNQEKFFQKWGKLI